MGSTLFFLVEGEREMEESCSFYETCVIWVGKEEAISGAIKLEVIFEIVLTCFPEL